MSQDICFHMFLLSNYSTHNPLCYSLWKRQKSKLWSQRWCVWRNSHKFMLLPGNRIRFFWLKWCLVGVSKRNTVEFSPHAALKPLTFFNFGVLVYIFFFFLSPLAVAADGSTCGTAAKRGNLLTKTDLSNSNVRAFILTPVNAGCESDPEGRL